MPRFDQSKLTPAAQAWLADFFDLPAVTPDIPCDTWCDALLSTQIQIATRLAEAGKSDAEIEENLRDRWAREEALLRNRPGYYKGVSDFHSELISQALELISTARRSSFRSPKQAEAEAKAAEERKRTAENREAFLRLLRVG
jgi:hypothetical protein